MALSHVRRKLTDLFASRYNVWPVESSNPGPTAENRMRQTTIADPSFLSIPRDRELGGKSRNRPLTFVRPKASPRQHFPGPPHSLSFQRIVEFRIREQYRTEMWIDHMRLTMSQAVLRSICSAFNERSETHKTRQMGRQIQPLDPGFLNAACLLSYTPQAIWV